MAVTNIDVFECVARTLRGVFEGIEVTGLPRYTISRGRIAAEEGVVLAKCGDGEFIAREPYPAVNKALSKWKEITSPRKVERSGIPAGV